MCAQATPGDERRTSGFILAHLSDVHLGPLPPAMPHHFIGKRLLGYLNWRRRRHIHRAEVLGAILADMRAQAPDHVALTGDLINLSLPAEFAMAAVWLRRLGPPERVSVVPGNHDAYVPLWRHQGAGLWAEYMRGDDGAATQTRAHAARSPKARQATPQFPYVRQRGGVAIIGLSSARPTAAAFAAGRLGKAQCAALSVLLARLRDRGLMRVVLIHHPPLPGMMDWRAGLHDAPALEHILKRHGAELVLHGHSHQPSLRWLDARTGPIPIVGAASASAARRTHVDHHDGEKPRAGYNLFRFPPAGQTGVIEMSRRGLKDDTNSVGELEIMSLSRG